MPGADIEARFCMTEPQSSECLCQAHLWEGLAAVVGSVGVGLRAVRSNLALNVKGTAGVCTVVVKSLTETLKWRLK